MSNIVLFAPLQQPSIRAMKGFRWSALVACLVSGAWLSVTSAADAQQPAATESQKIERLIRAVEQTRGAVFIRNGKEYDAPTAGKFLRGKWQAQARDIRSARDFIEKAASVSSTSGQPYRIRFTRGAEMTSEEFLSQELARLEKTSQ